MMWRHQVGAQQLVLRAFVISPMPAPATCFACDRRAIGTRDRRPLGGLIEAACIEHADTFNGTKGASS